MAALGVSDYAGVHGGLDAPAPLQISHRILVQVTGQHCGKARTHTPGWKLESTLSRHKADSEKKEVLESETQNRDIFYLLSTPTIVVLDCGISSSQREVHGCLRLRARPVFTHQRFHTLGSRCCCATQPTWAWIRKGDTVNRWCSSRTSPQPLADVTRLRARLMVPPPFPLWVDKEPDKTAVSLVVRGACSDMNGTCYLQSLHEPHSKTSRGLESQTSPRWIVICASCWFPNGGLRLQPCLHNLLHSGQTDLWHQSPH